MTDRAQKLIKYIFETEIDKIEGSRLSENKGLSALCLLYKTDLNPEELSKKYGVNIQFNNINTASVPEFISEISKYIDIKVFQSKPENQSKTEFKV
jgi:hypothetical protein